MSDDADQPGLVAEVGALAADILGAEVPPIVQRILPPPDLARTDGLPSGLPDRAAPALRGLADAGLIGLGISESRGGSGGPLVLGAAVLAAAGHHGAPVDVLHQQLAAHALASACFDSESVEAITSARRLSVTVWGAWGTRLSSPTEHEQPDELVVVDLARREVALQCYDAVLTTRSDAWLSPLWRDLELVLGGPGEGVDARSIDDVARLRATAHGLAASYLLGTAEGMLESTVSYARSRTQFGAPIGSFQAIKHSLADASISLRHARALVQGGLGELDAGEPGAALTLAMAKDLAGRAAQDCAERCVQVFGGIGFTWECDAHARLKSVLRLRHFPEPWRALRTELLDVRR